MSDQKAYDPANPAFWGMDGCAMSVVALDVGFSQDHSVATLAGVWPSGPRSVIGVKMIRQFPLNTPPDFVVDEVVEMARQYGSYIIWDSTNQSAMGALFAAKLGKRAQKQLAAAIITAAAEHSTGVGHSIISLCGMATAINKYSFAKRELVEAIEIEIRAQTLKIGRSDDSDWQILRDEMAIMSRRTTAAGRVSYAAEEGEGKHDDAVMSLALAVAFLRRHTGAVRRSITRPRGPKFTAAAWT